MFTSLRPTPLKSIAVTVNGQRISAPEGQSVWTTMALAGQTTTRKAALSGDKKSAYCAMGVCFECLVEIDGAPNQQACLRRVTDGMIITTQEITEQSVVNIDDI